MAIIPQIKLLMLKHPQESRLIYLLLVLILIAAVFDGFNEYFFAILVFFLGAALGKWLGTANPFKNEEVWVTMEEVQNGHNKNAKRK